MTMLEFQANYADFVYESIVEFKWLVLCLTSFYKSVLTFREKLTSQKKNWLILKRVFDS